MKLKICVRLKCGCHILYCVLVNWMTWALYVYAKNEKRRSIIQFVDGSPELIVWTRHRANHVHVHINIHLMNINQTRCHFLNNSVPISRHIYLITESKSIYKCWKHYSTHSFHRQRHKSKRLQWWSHRMISTLSWDLSKRRKCFHRQMHRCQRYHRPPYPWAM